MPASSLRRAGLFALAAVLAPVGVGCGGEGPVDDGPPRAPLVAEAGFLAVPAQKTGARYEARVFYSFRPADEAPEDKPVMLLFNGGPGAATSGYLMAHGTGPYTLDALGPVDAPPRENPESYTRFANLLYVDERVAGYSYGLADTATEPLCLGNETEEDRVYLADSGDYVLALLDFLDAHESLRDNPVVLAGESYGGTRAPLMLYLLQRYATAPLEQGPARIPELLPWLRERVQAHFDLVDPAAAGKARSPEEVAEQFGRMVLIQPNVGGQSQGLFESKKIHDDPDFAAFLEDPAAHYTDDVRQPASYGVDVDARASLALHDPARAELLLGVAPADVPGLPANQRGHAFRRFFPDADPAVFATAEAPMAAALGALEAGDGYWQNLAPHCLGATGDTRVVLAWFDVVQRTRTFHTRARYDAVVYSAAFAPFLGSFGLDVSVDESVPAGAARPGVMRIQTSAGPIEVRYPAYEAGHMVTLSAGKELGEDLEAWLAEP